MSVRNLDKIFKPQRIAVIGASDEPPKVGWTVLHNLIGAGFSGVVLFSYYQYKLNQSDARVNTVISGYKKQFANAEGNLAATVWLSPILAKPEQSMPGSGVKLVFTE